MRQKSGVLHIHTKLVFWVKYTDKMNVSVSIEERGSCLPTLLKGERKTFAPLERILSLHSNPLDYE